MQEIHKKQHLAVMGRIKGILRSNGFFFLAIVLVLLLNLQFDFYYIKTGSMEPELSVGTVVVVDADVNVQVKTGDICAYRSGRNVVIHRIIAADEEGYTFKGDANPSADAAKVTENQLVG